MVITKKNRIHIDMGNYKEALKKSLFDEEWISNLYTDKTNILKFFESIGSNRPIKNASQFMESMKIKHLIETKNSSVLPEFACQRFYEAGKSEQNIRMINEIYSETNYYANRIEDLLNEYSENTRDFGEYTIAPFPEDIEDTWKPITRFKINDIPVTLAKNSITLENKNHKMNDYFENRKKKKLIKKLYITYKNLSEDNFRFAKRFLLNHKEAQIPVNFASTLSENCSYRITCNANQTVNRNGIEYTLTGNGIHVYHITEVNNEQK